MAFVVQIDVPDEDVDLLVDDVEREDAHGVVLLDLAGRTELVEGALRHAREDVDHRVDSILLKVIYQPNVTSTKPKKV